MSLTLPFAKILTFAVIFFAACLGAVQADDCGGDVRTASGQHSVISSSDYRVIENATVALKEFRPDWSTYKILVSEEENTFVVEFWQPKDDQQIYLDIPSTGRRDAKNPWIINKKRLAVVLDKKTLTILSPRSRQIE